MFKLLSDLLLLFKLIDEAHERRHRKAKEKGKDYPAIIKKESIAKSFDAVNDWPDHQSDG